MPAKKKFPKAPKAGASKETLLRYEAKCKEVSKHNNAIEAKEKEKKSIRDRAAKLKSK